MMIDEFVEAVLHCFSMLKDQCWVWLLDWSVLSVLMTGLTIRKDLLMTRYVKVRGYHEVATAPARRWSRVNFRVVSAITRVGRPK